jgi:branched-chain amino acid transport system ATP-binding protein
MSEPEATSAARLIECRDLSAGYGSMAVVRGLDLHVDAGEVVALIGANGAGKTTTLLTVAGELAPLGGEVRLRGERATSPMHVRCREGMGFLTEERSVIMGLSAGDNLKLAGVDSTVAVELFPELGQLLGRPAGLLSGGEQQMLSLARALGRAPSILLADELSLGLAPKVVDRLLTAVRRAADERGVGVLLVEQHVRQALAVADRLYVMERGQVSMSGPTEEMRSRLDAIEAAYLSGASPAPDAPTLSPNGET